MAALDDILAILLGRKVKDDAGIWHTYNNDGNEISDPNGILLRGNIGALLTWPNTTIRKIKSKTKESISIGGNLNIPLLMNQRVYKEVSTNNKTKLIQEDEEIVVLLQSLFIQGVL